MNHPLDRREFLSSSLAAAGTLLACGTATGAAAPEGTLPMVRWGKHDISRLLVGHNPLKGQSYTSSQLDQEMRQWYDPNQGHDVELLQRCQAAGINTCQMGATAMEDVLRRFYARGGRMQWIPTFYSKPGEAKEELKRVLSMEPRPIGIQHYGGVTDTLFNKKRLDDARDTLKMFRDAGVLVGFGSHNPRAIEYAEEKGFDVDFYQCCFYQHVHEKVWKDEERQRMVATIRRVSKPCIAFKVLGGNRHTKTPEDLYNALKFAFDHIKPTDVVLLGMWQKYKDQVGENHGLAWKILTPGGAGS